MGIGASWISVAGLSRSVLLDRLDLEETGESRGPHDWFDRNQIGCAELPSGRVMVISENCEFFDEKAGLALSVGAEALICQIEEHVMHAAAYGFRDGQLIWSVVRDINLPDEDENALTIKGTPPAEFADIRARNEKRLKEDPDVGWMWEAVVEIAASIGRYRHDEDIEGFSPVFHLLEEAGSAGRRAALVLELAAREAAKAEKAAAWKASGGLAGAVKRMFGGR
jgi:hypothetical protein